MRQIQSAKLGVHAARSGHGGDPYSRTPGQVSVSHRSQCTVMLKRYITSRSHWYICAVLNPVAMFSDGDP